MREVVPPALVDDEAARRGVRQLGFSFGLAWIAVSLVVGPGPAAWVRLAGDVAQSGLFFGVYALAAAAGAALGGRAMDRWGARPTLVASHLTAAAGFVVAGLAYGAGTLPGFALGTVVLAFGFGSLFLTRVAAVDLVPPAERGRAVAVVQLSALFGAVLGPVLLVAGEGIRGTLGRDPRDLVWWVSPAVLLLSAFVVSRAPQAPRHAAAAVTGAASDAPPALRLVLAGAAAIALAEAAMVAVMGVTGAALAHEGHGAGATGTVLAAHFVGMFGLSLFVGRVTDRIGRRLTIVAGALTLMLGGALVALDLGVAAFALGLLLIGLGWSFAYIGGTILLADVAPPARRASLTGRVDLVARLGAATAATLGGVWFASRGLPGLGAAAIAIVLVPLALALSIREPEPGRYAMAAAPALR